MHMLVLYANTGCKMDLSSFGYTVEVIQRALPLSEYTPCIEEHNIHAIFRWASVLYIYRDCSCSGGTSLVQATSEEEKSMDFLQQTGLTLSVTTLGTCIYRFGKKRSREVLHNAGEYTFPTVYYTSETEEMIFKICRYVHKVVSSS